jgi:hypothetical protein
MGLSISAPSPAEDVITLDDASPEFHEGIERVLRDTGRQGAVVPENSVAVFEARSDGLMIKVAVQTEGDLIAGVVYDGKTSRAERAVLEQLSTFANGATVREFVEHSLTFVVEHLRNPAMPRPVDGILSPRNASPCFQRPGLLIKALRAAYLSQHGDFVGDNIFDRPYSERWLAMSNKEKESQLETLIQAFREQVGLDEAAMAVFEIDQYDRVVVIFGPEVGVWDKPTHLLGLERWLRRQTGERIEVFVEIAKDSNRIRRL